MGCCLSSGRERRRRLDGGTPPPSSPPVEEETVKEVLLETPVRPKSAISSERIKEKPEIDGERKINCSNQPKIAEQIVSEVSEVSEMHSVSGSFSNTTAPERNYDEDGGEVSQGMPLPRKLRQGDVGLKKRVPARRPAAPLPEKRGQVTPLTPAPSRPAGGHRRDVDAEKRGWRDSGESSSRMSRSPAKRGNVCGRRNMNKNVRNCGADGGVVEEIPVEPPHDGEPSEEVESLENPVVSLECFIFL